MDYRRYISDPAWRREITLDNGKTLTVRLAEPCDYSGVVHIDKNHTVYDGHDYIPHLYHIVLQEKDSFPFLAELEGTIVYFTLMHLVEECTGSVSCAARVSEEYKGHRIANQARKALWEILTSNIPSVKHDRWTGVMWPHLLDACSKPDPAFAVLQKWNFRAFIFEGDQLRQHITEVSTLNQPLEYKTRPLTKLEVVKLLTDPEHCVRVITDGRIYTSHNWMPHNVPTSPPHANLIYSQSVFYGVFDDQGDLQSVITTCIFPSVVAIENHVFYHGSSLQGNVVSALTRVCEDFERHARGGQPLTLCYSSTDNVDTKHVMEFFTGCNMMVSEKAGYMCAMSSKRSKSINKPTHASINDN